jgi:bisphosphoglycerate-dependent phosphoglycerate mutase
MYGALQGKNKAETAAQYGEEQVKVCWILFLNKIKC